MGLVIASGSFHTTDMKANLRPRLLSALSPRAQRTNPTVTPGPRPLAAIALLLLASACVPQIEAPNRAPRPVQRPMPPARPEPLPAQRPAPTDWRDAPRTAGDWHWSPAPGGTRAVYTAPNGTAALTLMCNRAARTIMLLRNGQAPAPLTMQITTTFGSRTFTASPVPGGMALTLSANDPQLDAMAFSRGRFAVSMPGFATLYLPSWAEVGRVTEDCR